MIPARGPAGQPDRWQAIVADAITDPALLLAELGLDPLLLPAARRAAERFGLKVPRPLLDRIRRGDPADPILRQVLPLSDELTEVPDFVTDPVGDLPSALAPGVLHKYRGRALLVTTGACGVHCRYCFRREFPYGEQLASADRFRPALAAIAADPSITEVILSGGDPLSLSTARLTELTAGLAHVAHVRRLRIHTRQPIVVPQRVDAALTAWLRALPWPVSIVVHVNHANELDDATVTALAALRATGATLLNQAVLLRGVNDDADSLAALGEALFDAGVLPYYLHQLDRVRGAAHFEVPDAEALELMAALRDRLPGYLVPRLVREVAGAGSKTPVAV